MATITDEMVKRAAAVLNSYRDSMELDEDLAEAVLHAAKQELSPLDASDEVDARKAHARLIGIIIRLRQIYSPEGVGVWLFSVNRKLDGCVPWTLMIDGRLDEVEDALPPLEVAT